MTAVATPIPIEIGRAHEHDIRVRWNDGHESVYIARELRLRCPCAVCVEERTGQSLLDASTVPADVHPLGITLVGRYGIEIQWSDGHATGIYTFAHLRASCPCAECRGRSGGKHPGVA